jgi:quercetin dioxygenase-like cupin family protein
MPLFAWDRIDREQMNPLLSRQVIHTDQMTIARLSLKQGAVVPEHRHVNEQVTVLERGRLRFIIDGIETILEGGQALQIPSQAVHRVEALEDSEAMDLFSPRREDWLRGDDSYLRQPRG